MKKMSLWGLSHLDYTGRQELFFKKISDAEWIPIVIGFLTPGVYAFVSKILEPKIFSKSDTFFWFICLIVISGTAFSALIIYVAVIKQKVAEFVPSDAGLWKLEQIKALYSMNSGRAWKAFYRLRYASDFAKFLGCMQIGCGLFGYIYFF